MNSLSGISMFEGCISLRCDAPRWSVLRVMRKVMLLFKSGDS